MNAQSSASTADTAVSVSVVEIAMIAALDENDLIGANGGMPWHLPVDLRYFKRTTLHKPVIMGRRTFESIGRALPHRHNLVLTRNPEFAAEGCERVASLDEARAFAAGMGAAQLVVIGGAQLYAAALAEAQRLYITRVHARYEGDTWFPKVDWSQWQLVSSEEHVPDDGVTPVCTFTEWRR